VPRFSIPEELAKAVDPAIISTTDEVLAEHASDKWHATHRPDVVVLARNTEDVSRTLAFAHKYRIPVTTRGAGTGHCGGCVPIRGGIALSVFGMKKIIELNPSDGVAVVEPGVITGDLQSAAKTLGWCYPPDPASLKESSIGGNIATNAGGPRCLKYGVTRNYVLGLEVVLSDGRVLRTGGRVHKNKTGFDLTATFVGSEGMLGVVTQATLRLIPDPPARAMLAAVFPTFEQTASAVQAILDRGHLPSALEITDEFTLNAARQRLGADRLPQGKGHLIIEIDGQPEAVAGELQTLERTLVELGAVRGDRALDEPACDEMWELRREFSYSLKATGLTKLNEDVVVPRSKLVELTRFAQQLAAETGIAVACFGHAGDGNIHTNLMVDNYDDQATREKAHKALDILFSWVLENGGAITGEHGVGLAKSRWLPGALGDTSLRIHRDLKDLFDPHRILNPGKWGMGTAVRPT
jgi:glycolate oxidase